MRHHGLVDSPRDVGLNGHACWGFDGAGDLAAAAEVFLTDGAELGQQLMFVVEPGEVVVLDLAGLEFVDHRGVLAVESYSRRVADQGGEVRLRRTPPLFRRLSDLLGAGR